MSDINSKIVIEDGFSDTLDSLGEKTDETRESVDDLNESIEKQGEVCEETAKKINIFDRCLGGMQNAYQKVSEAVSTYAFKVSDLTRKLTDSSEAQSNIMKFFFTGNDSDGLINKYFDHMNDVITNNIEQIELADKIKAMYGEAGDEALEASSRLAMRLGEDSKEVTKLAVKGAQQGIGTAHFERIMNLADRVGSLNAGETTTGVAEQLMQNIKSGHDAGTIASMYGGGEKMERQLRAAGYERALNHGDIDKALDIAEQIAEQAGYTEEAYGKATNSLSKNWKRIGVFVENIKQRITNLYTQTFEPLVQYLSDFLQSDGVQKAITIVDGIAHIVVDKISKAIRFIVDNIETIFKIQMIATAWALLKPLRLAHKAMRGCTASLLLWVAIGVGVVALANHILQKLGVTKSLAGMIAGTFVFWKNVIGNIPILIENIYHSAAGMYYKIKLMFKNSNRTVRTAIADTIIWFIEKIRWAIKESGLSKVFDFLGIKFEESFDNASKKLKEWGMRGALGATADKAMTEINDRLNIYRHKFAKKKYGDSLAGVDKAYQTKDFGELGDKVTNFFSEFSSLTGEVTGIKTNTDAIRKYNEQEEDLGWLKLFSDRQIMSSYNSSTSNIRNVTFNGVSQAGMLEMGRRNISTMPSRSLM